MDHTEKQCRGHHRPEGQAGVRAPQVERKQRAAQHAAVPLALSTLDKVTASIYHAPEYLSVLSGKPGVFLYNFGAITRTVRAGKQSPAVLRQ